MWMQCAGRSTHSTKYASADRSICPSKSFRGGLGGEVAPEHAAGSREAGAIGERDVYFAEAGGFHTTPVLSRNRLAPGTQIKGPAIIEESESTVVVGPGAQVTVDETGNLVMRLEGKQIPG